MNEWNNWKGQLTSWSIFACEFRMLRNGKCFFAVDKSKKPKDPTTLQWLLSQCYYFLKDAVHQHYHHEESTDAIIELTPINNKPDWRLRTLRNLYRKVISLRRTLDDELLSDALGVMSYASVFRSLFDNKDYDVNAKVFAPSQALPEYHPNELTASIEIRRDMSRRSSDNRRSEAQFVIASIVALGILYISLLPALTNGSLAKHVADLAMQFISNFPYALIFPPVVMYYGYRWYTHAHDLKGEGFLRTFYRLFAWLPRRGYIAVGIILSLLCALIVVVSLWQIARHARAISTQLKVPPAGAPHASPMPAGAPHASPTPPGAPHASPTPAGAPHASPAGANAQRASPTRAVQHP